MVVVVLFVEDLVSKLVLVDFFWSIRGSGRGVVARNVLLAVNNGLGVRTCCARDHALDVLVMLINTVF
jgi:hypothetical protein